MTRLILERSSRPATRASYATACSSNADTFALSQPAIRAPIMAPYSRKGKDMWDACMQGTRGKRLES
eukprot:CAMPEP_0202509984 /NCGR_PEP_ID=MMETSP1361-20130828/53059_1 /ASSEMBLY_ACC=CAM_ASM_000849 /TAXON_ID=210615 /ORGANISM="Staurosira complex sp., Strain CCMP2646" /LENGTH=66 /DNA_ID=CAMNT_0049144227 /DNA_START=17 /DNA_END=217 /DNA_ORIENTATION=-